MDKKVKSKSKSKAPDGRKNLSSVRVIQRNLVYIVGLPLTLADEDVCKSPSVSPALSFCLYFSACFLLPVYICCLMQLLQGTEYFAQYGKVLKVSISRTAAGTIQQFPNSTCSV